MDPQFLSQTLLFRGIAPEDIRAMSSCLGFREADYPRGAVIYLTGGCLPTADLPAVLLPAAAGAKRIIKKKTSKQLRFIGLLFCKYSYI